MIELREELKDVSCASGKVGPYLQSPAALVLMKVNGEIDPVLVEVTGRYVHNKHQQILRIYKMPKSIYSQYLFIIDKTL